MLQIPVGNPLYSGLHFVRYHTSMPRHTDAKIRELCVLAVAAETQEDIDCVLLELRAALEEHIQLARNSLEIQRASVASLVAISRRA